MSIRTRLFIALLLLIAPLSTPPVTAAPSQGQVLEQSAGVVPVRAHLSPFPPGVGAAHLVVEVDDGGHDTIPAVKFRREVMVVADMPSMPKMKGETARLRAAGGTGRTSRWEGGLTFTMEGAWRLRFIVGTQSGEFQMVSMVDVRGVSEGDPQPPPTAEIPAAATPAAATLAPGASASPAPPLTPTSLPSRGPSSAVASAAHPDDIRVTCLQRPPRVGDNRMLITLPAGARADLPVVVGVDMPGMAMAVPPRTATRQRDGQWAVDMPLSMAGVWTVTVEAGPHRATISLTVPSPRAPSPSTLLLVTLACLTAVGCAALALRGRPIAPFGACAALLAAVLVAGIFIERRWPPDTSMGMAMDMTAPDMGMSDMIAPQPVIEARVQRLSLTRTRSLPARVHAGTERVIVAAGSGGVHALAEPGQRVTRGETVAVVSGGPPLAAPFPGVVVERFTRVGAMVADGCPLLLLGDVRTVRVEGRLAQHEADELTPGTTVDVVAGSRTGQGRLERISALSEGSDVQIVARIDNLRATFAAMDMGKGSQPRVPRRAAPTGVFAVGQDVSMRCVLETAPAALVVPTSAVHGETGEPWVFVIETAAGQGVARRRRISTGLRSDTHTQVTSGLREGERVVAVGDASLRDGMVVTAGHWGEGAWRRVLLPQDEAMPAP